MSEASSAWWHRFAQEPVCSAGVSSFQEHEVDQPAVLVNCTEHVLLSAGDLEVRLIDSQGSRAIALISPHALPRARAHSDAPSAGWVYFHASLLDHLGQVLVGDPVLAIPAQTDQDDLDREATALRHEPC